tara:strand:+ start:275 stop:379 length:105 start_codon:yes stop_codon:yes gene_type:complete
MDQADAPLQREGVRPANIIREGEEAGNKRGRKER